MLSLTEHLAQKLNITSAQAEGGAGLLLCLAQLKLTQAEFQQVADSIPAISDIMAKAPRFEAKITSPLRAALSRACGGLGGLTFLVGAFQILKLNKTMLPPFVATMLDFFKQAGGDQVESLLKQALR